MPESVALDMLTELDFPEIVGWMVGDNCWNAAMYNRSEGDKAFDAARRWNSPITALVIHPGSPAIDAALAEGKE